MLSSARRCRIEHRERTLAQIIARCVEELSVLPNHCVRANRRRELRMLQLRRQLGERPMRPTVLCEECERAIDPAPVRGSHHHALERHEDLDPLCRPQPIRRLIDSTQRLKTQHIDSTRCEIVVRCPRSMRQRPHRIADIEGEDLRAGVASKLRGKESEQRALP